MAQSFSINLHNPAVKSSPDDLIFTGLPNGNSLNVVLTNKSGYPLAFKSDPNKYLLIKISSDILDATAASAIRVDSPWTIAQVVPPTAPPAGSGALQYYGLKLKPIDAAGVDFPAVGNITIQLTTIKPSAVGSGAIVANYDFEALTLNVSSQLTVLSSGSTGKQLIGSNNALQYTRQVNGGDELNPIVATSTEQPVTAANGAANTIHVQLFFQNPSSAGGQSTLGELVPSWDAAHPPTFKFRFPYFGPNSIYPPYADLTDDFRKEDTQNYNEFTSAWNIKLSLDRDNPAILENDWWIITPPAANMPSPYWLVRPKSVNTYLFTGSYTGPHSAGPFLDLYYSHIFSNLPVKPNQANTQIILETFQFPGFNDGLLPQPLQKIESVEIRSFSGQVNYSPVTGTVLALNWDTRNAEYCTIAGFSEKLQTVMRDHKVVFKPAHPLPSALTLTAHDKYGVAKISRTIYVRWKADDNGQFTPSETFWQPMALSLAPNAKTVYVVGGLDGVNSTAGVALLDGENLVKASYSVKLPDNASARNVVATPNGLGLLVAGTDKDITSGKVYGFITSTPPTPLPGSPSQFDYTLLPNLYQLAVSDDSTQLLLSGPFASRSPFLAGLKLDFAKKASLSLLPEQNNPRIVEQLNNVGLAVSGAKLFYPVENKGIGVLTRTDLQPVAGSPIALPSDVQKAQFTAGPMLVSRDGKTLTTLARGFDADFKRLFLLCQVDVPTMTLVRRVQVFTGFQSQGDTPSATLLYSVDEAYIFVLGLNYGSTPDNTSRVGVYDAKSLQEQTWSPIATPLINQNTNGFVVDMKMAPDGTRIYALTLDANTSTKSTGRVQSFIPYL